MAPSETDEPEFTLIRESTRGKTRSTFEGSDKTNQTTLFPGSHSCLPGQADLFNDDSRKDQTAK